MARKKATIWERASAGTYDDVKAPKGVRAFFVAVMIVIVLIPLVGMIWARTDTTTENRELAAVPVLFDEDGSFNWGILSDWGAYFEDHFAYRNEAVTLNAELNAAFGVSTTDQVVVGTDGWLYYGGTLPDYLGQGLLPDRSLHNIAHNLKLAQDYVEGQGSSFVFALAPNKNSLDDSNMPYYYLRYEGSSDAERLKPLLDEAGVKYADLFGLFKSRMASGDDFGYLKLDSHWNNLWAYYAAGSMISLADHEPIALSAQAGELRDDFEGDLQSMLYPAAPRTEENYYFKGVNDRSDGTGVLWRYAEGTNVTDSVIKTAANSEVEGTLLMFRDSFGNALVPFMASSFESATFSKMVPYNLTQNASLGADTVIIERAERHLDYLASNPPIIANPMSSQEEGLPVSTKKTTAEISISSNGTYWVVKGTVTGKKLEPDSKIFVLVEQLGKDPIVIDPFWTSAANSTGDIVGEQSFILYEPLADIDFSNAAISVYVS